MDFLTCLVKMQQGVNTHIHHNLVSRAYNGDSILQLPVDRIFLNRGVFATYDGKNFRPAPRMRQPGQDERPPPDSGSASKDTTVVLEALQRILRKKEDKPDSWGEFGQARPIR